MLEPTGNQPECYRRIGIVEIPEEDGIAEGWYTKVVTIA
jgi:hypothetical protein